MKKPSLNKDGIQQFFLANGEKLLLGITVRHFVGLFLFGADRQTVGRIDVAGGH